MNDRQLRYAHAIWSERSFSRAAAKMGVSQPSLSEQIRLLEEELGFSLFYRNSRGVEASANGQTFLESAAGVVSGMSGLKELARELRGKPGTTIRIGVNSGLAQALVPRIARILARTNAKTRPELITATTRRVLRLVHQQRVDLGVIFEGEIKPATTAEKLVRTPLTESAIVLLVPPAHPLAKRREPMALAELVKQPLLVNEPRLGYGKILLDLFAERDLAPDIAGDCDDLESLKYMVELGGLALAPRIIAEDELTRGTLCAVALEDVPPVTVQLVRRPEALEPRIERIRTQLTKELSEPEPVTPA